MFSTFQAAIGAPARWLFSPREGADSESDGWETESVSEWPFEPRISDVMVVKAMISKALDLPNEIVDKIVDLAEYWPHTSAESDRSLSSGVSTLKTIRAGVPATENAFLLRSVPLGFPPVPKSARSEYAMTEIPPAPLKQEFTTEQFQEHINSNVPLLERPCRMIVFTIDSRDQGWGVRNQEEGRYGGSWTWFSAGVERFEAGESSPAADETTENAVVSQIALTEDEPYAIDLDKLRTVWPEVQVKSQDDPAGQGDDEQNDAEYEYHYELLPREDNKIQANLPTHRKTVQHRVVWKFTDDIDPESERAVQELEQEGRGKATGNGEYVRNLKLGDVITVWGHSRFPGWVNYVEKVKIEVYYAV